MITVISQCFYECLNAIKKSEILDISIMKIVMKILFIFNFSLTYEW